METKKHSAEFQVNAPGYDNDQLIRHAGVWRGLELEYSWGYYAVYCGSTEDATLVGYFGDEDYRVIKRFTGETAIHDAIRECDDQYWANYS